MPPPVAAADAAAPEGGQLRFPERSWSEWAWAAGVFLVTCAAYLPFLRTEWLDPDEGILLQGAQRILHGQVLYRDFFGFYTPGSYYGLALLFRWFGDSLLTGRVMLLIEGGLMAALTYLIARRVAARWAAVLAAYAMAAVTLPFDFVILHNWDSTLLAFVALYAAVLWLQKQHRASAAAVGFFAALTCLDEQSKGAGLVLGLALAGVWLARQPQWRKRLRRDWRWLAGAFAAPVAVTAIYFAWQGAFRAMLGDVLWPLRHYGGSNALPYGYMFFRAPVPARGTWLAKATVWITFSPHFALLLFPWVAVGVAAFLWLQRRPGRPGGLAREYYAVVGCALMGLLLSVLVTRQDYRHLLFLTPIFALVLAWVMGREAAGRRARMAGAVIGVYVLLFFTLAGVQYWSRAIWGYPQTMATAHGPIRVAVADPVLEYLGRLPPGPIFVYPYMPDYYYLSGRANATGFEWLQFGLNSAGQFRQAEEELARTRPAAVLFDFELSSMERSFPSTPAGAIGHAYRLERYVLTHYHNCGTVGIQPLWRFAMMLRRDLPCPAGARPNRGRGNNAGRSRDRGSAAATHGR